MTEPHAIENGTMVETSHQSPPPPAPPTRPFCTPVMATTRRGIATGSFAIGMWGLLVFWWYPFGMSLAVVGLILGIISVALGIRGGKDGEHIAWMGIVFSSIGIGLAIGLYRFVQYAFEGSLTGGMFDM
jgi:hypothetical protein